MDRFVPLSKKSKKEQKKFHAMQRRTSCVARSSFASPPSASLDKERARLIAHEMHRARK